MEAIPEVVKWSHLVENDSREKVGLRRETGTEPKTAVVVLRAIHSISLSVHFFFNYISCFSISRINLKLIQVDLAVSYNCKSFLISCQIEPYVNA